MKRKTTVAVLVRNDIAPVQNYWIKGEIAFPGIPDPEGKIGSLYGQNEDFAGRALPAVFIVNRKGKIAYSLYAESISRVPNPFLLLNIIDSVAPAETDTSRH